MSQRRDMNLKYPKYYFDRYNVKKNHNKLIEKPIGIVYK